VTGDHEGIYSNGIAQYREKGLYDILKGFGGVKALFTVQIEGFDYAQLAKWYSLYLRKAPQRNAILHIIQDRDLGLRRDKKYCPCFQKMLDEWDKRGVRSAVTYASMKRFIRSNGSTISVPAMGDRVVVTSHVWRELGEVMTD
jgi:hypothetical protein